jgi:lipoate-protein ligase B
MRVLIRRHTVDHPWRYSDAVKFQNHYFIEIQNGAPGVMLLSEFAPVVTLGRGHQPSDFLLPSDQIESAGIQVLPVDRGGRATYHGPGQWTLFVIDRMENLVGEKLGIKKMVSKLLTTAEKTCDAFQVKTERHEGADLGLWILPKNLVDSRPVIPKKVASVGIRVARGIVTHGVALNGYPTPESFFGIHPCGITSATAGFVFENDTENNVLEKFDELGQEFLRQASKVFNVDLEFDGDFDQQWGRTV